VIQKKILCYCPPIRYTLNLNTMITMQKHWWSWWFQNSTRCCRSKYNLLNDVRFRIENRWKNTLYQIEKGQRKVTIWSKKRAEQIQLSNWRKSINFRQLFHYRFKNKFRNQEIEITLYLPKGTLKPDDLWKIMIVPMRTTFMESKFK
jgi:site-specific recombinase XerD